MIPFVIMTIESEDDRAFMTLVYQRHRALMLKTAWDFTREKADVEDIVSDSCVALINNIDKLRGMEEAALRRYIVLTVRSKGLDLCKRRKRQYAHIAPEDDNLIDRLPDPESLEKKILLMDELRRMQILLRQLPERERDVLRMKYQQGMKHKEIAEVLGIEENTVATYVTRARSRLKAALY